MTTIAVETIEVTMPQMGVSVTEGTVVEWKVAVGDAINVDETICEISTDKVETEVPAPASGTVLEIVVAPDETVPVGTVLARIAPTDAAAGAISPRADGPRAGRAPAAASPKGPGVGYSPVVRRVAEAHGIDLQAVTGTGRRGRVTKQDVLAFVEARDGDRATAPLMRAARAPVAAGNGAISEATTEPLTRIRSAIAEHMTRSLATAAHCHTFIEADMSQVETVRRELGVTALAIVTRATVEALRAHLYLNAWLDADQRTLHESVHIGIAVSLGENGLIVPVIRNAESLSVEGLALEIKSLAARARTGGLSPDDVRGGTFTITNQGRYGTLMSTPIIHQPQVGILDVEAIVKRPVVVGDAIAIRPTTILGLGWDHRALDGAGAAAFLATLRDKLENWR